MRSTLPTDDPAICNVSFTYTGPNFNIGSPSGTEHDLGHFIVYSTRHTVVLKDFTSLDVLNHGPTKGTAVATIGSNAVGVAGSGTVPEPTAWATMVIGPGLIGGSMRRRGSRSVAA